MQNHFFWVFDHLRGVFIDFFSFSLIGDGASAGVALTNLMRTLGMLVSGIWTINRVMTTMSSVERIKEYVEFDDHEAEWEVPEEDSKTGEKWPTEGTIEISNLKVRYRDGLPLVLRGLNMKIEANQKVGIVGRTGSGKSTLMLALMRILERPEEEEHQESFIKIDGVDIYRLGLHKLRKMLVIIPQDPFLMEGTLRSNLDPTGSYTSQELIDGLQTVEFFSTVKENQILSLKEKTEKIRNKSQPKIDQTPQKIEKESEENVLSSLTDDQKLLFTIEKSGSNLSLGQRQLVCIARALVNRPKILLMDEATASVDQKTDEIIQRVIMEEMTKTTILTIAHRINTVIGYDKIVVLDHGRKIEEGSPRELMESGGAFSGMVDDCGPSFRSEMLNYLSN